MLLVPSPSAIEAAFTVHDKDAVHVSPALWNEIAARKDVDHAFVSLISKDISLTAVAILDDQVFAQSRSYILLKYLQAASDILLPHQLKGFFLDTHYLRVQLTQPVLLSNIFLSALSIEAYDTVRSEPGALERAFSKDRVILRQGDTLSLNDSLQYRIDMLEPTLQGFAQIGHTRFHITLISPSQVHLGASSSASESDPDSIELDEIFLANSLLLPQQGEGSSTYDVEAKFASQPLSHPVDQFLDGHSMYLRTSELGRIGTLSGDWVRGLRSKHKAILIASRPSPDP